MLLVTTVNQRLFFAPLIQVEVGVPIMITVEEESDIGAFTNYEMPVATDVSPVTTLPVDTPPPAVVNTISTPASIPSAHTSVTFQSIQSASTPAVPVIAANAVVRVNAMKPQFRSPLVDKISADQQIYIDRFGRTGHRPLVVSNQ